MYIDVYSVTLPHNLFVKKAAKHLKFPQNGNAVIARIAANGEDPPKRLLSLPLPKAKDDVIAHWSNNQR